MKKVCVFGLWHLGSVTAACLAKLGFQVHAVDIDTKVIGDLRNGKAPLFEPGLDDLIQQGLTEGRLTFSSDLRAGLEGADAVWVTFDTPVDANNHADVGFI